MTKFCAHCHTEMERPAWAADSQWASRRYCSHSCVASARWAGRTKPSKPCKSCGAIFDRNAKYSREQWERAEFCSNKCRGVSLAIERKVCACGCGERVSKPRSVYRPGHNDQSNRRKLVKFDGRRFYVRDRQGRKVYWYRAVMMGMLRRELVPGEVVHHLNGDRTDDRPENLSLYSSHAQHMRDEYQAGNLPAMN